MATVPARPYVVLNVNDDEPRRYLIGKFLRDGGFSVAEAADGAAALALVGAQHPDIVLLDVKLPDLNGFEVCRRIKLDPATSAIPVVLLSEVLTEDVHRVQGLDSGADGYLTEPHPAVTIATIRALLRAREAEDARRESEAQERQRAEERDRFRALSLGILRAREDEARRIAHELHNESSQLVASVHIVLANLLRDLPPEQRARFGALNEVLDRAEEHLRGLAHELRPPILDDLGLEPALEQLAERVTARTGVEVEVAAGLRERMAPVVETAAYRIVQEAMTNAIKHARPQHVRVELSADGARLRVSVRDDGTGFDVDAALRRTGDRGLGLIGIRERVEALAGALAITSITSGPGRGTDISIAIPFESDGTPDRPR